MNLFAIKSRQNSYYMCTLVGKRVLDSSITAQTDGWAESLVRPLLAGIFLLLGIRFWTFRLKTNAAICLAGRLNLRNQLSWSFLSPDITSTVFRMFTSWDLGISTDIPAWFRIRFVFVAISDFWFIVNLYIYIVNLEDFKLKPIVTVEWNSS